jgi:ssDNA-binding Zn-finger/Zn-ribbon topoisomerase 1
MHASRIVEWGLTALVLALALLPLVVLAWRSSRRGIAYLLVVGWLVVPLAATWGAVLFRSVPTPEAEVKGRPIEAPLDEYVTSKTCESCHPSQYASWHRSYHRTMTQAVTPASMRGDFDDVRLEHDGKIYDLTRDDDAFWVEMDDPDRRDTRTAPRVKRRVMLSTGSHLDQMYWLDAGRGDRNLMTFPFFYSLRMNRWLPLEAAYMAPPGAQNIGNKSGFWNTNCLKCHSTAADTRLEEGSGASGQPSFDTQVVEFGISCEACHGPAAEHVRINRDPAHRFGQYLGTDADLSIVNPGKLDAKRSSEVCGQCHGLSIPLAEGRKAMLSDPNAPGYKPGDDIYDTRIYLRHQFTDPDFETDDEVTHARTLAHARSQPRFVDGNFWPDGMVRVSGRDYSSLLESGCYQEGEISCISCHSMHKGEGDERSTDEWAHHQMKPEMYGNQACLQCHETYAEPDALAAHSHHESGSTGSSCYNCHMPYTTFGMLKGIRSHDIASPSVTETVNTGRPNACNLCHLDQTMSWAADHLSSWYGTPPPELSEDQRRIAAGPLWALTARAGVRALTTYSMGWDAAIEASGSDWMAPILSELLADRYYTVRYNAERALRRIEGFEDFDYDYVLADEEQADAVFRARMIWSAAEPPAEKHRVQALLRFDSGTIDGAEMGRLQKTRDDTPVWILE